MHEIDFDSLPTERTSQFVAILKALVYALRPKPSGSAAPDPKVDGVK